MIGAIIPAINKRIGVNASNHMVKYVVVASLPSLDQAATNNLPGPCERFAVVTDAVASATLIYGCDRTGFDVAPRADEL